MQTQIQKVVTCPAESIQYIFIAAAWLSTTGGSCLAHAKGYFISKARYPSQQGYSMSILVIRMQRFKYSQVCKCRSLANVRLQLSMVSISSRILLPIMPQTKENI